MARRYHINPDTGRPNICRAQTPERCEYAQNGEVPEHYDTKEEAREAYAKSMSGHTVSTVSKIQETWTQPKSSGSVYDAPDLPGVKIETRFVQVKDLIRNDYAEYVMTSTGDLAVIEQDAYVENRNTEIIAIKTDRGVIRLWGEDYVEIGGFQQSDAPYA